MLIDATAKGVVVRGVHDLDSLAVLIESGTPRDALDARLRTSGVGEMDGDRALIVVASLRSQGPADPEWTRRWEAMIEYARTRGWVSPDGRHLLAHVQEELSGPDSAVQGN